ncbi:MAG: DinB family protein [Candidatus Xenobia bacterium]
MKMVDMLLAELDAEAKTTRKFLQAVPHDSMGWKPHEKSMTAGKLAMHVATLEGFMADQAVYDQWTMTGPGPEVEPTKSSILEAFEKSHTHAREVLSKFDDEKMLGTWKFVMGGQEINALPRWMMIRSFLLNHLYHHRGQLGVYLRLLGAKVPSSYGPSADDNPMAEMMAAGKKA